MLAAQTRTVKQWAAATSPDSPDMYMDYFFDRTVRPPSPPKSTRAVPRRLFRPDRFGQAPMPYAATIGNGAFYGERGAIFAADRTVLEDVSAPAALRSLRTLDKLPPASYLAETVAPLTYKFANNYFHWMMDILPRLLLLRLTGIPIDRYIISPQGRYPYLETLRLLHVPEEALLVSDAGCHVLAKRLVVTSAVSHKQCYPRWAFEFLRRELAFASGGKPPDETYDKIYISRAKAGKRKVVNEAEVARLLKRYGFRIVELENMPLADQIHLFQSARTIVAPHGAGLTNLVFSPPGVKLIELFSPNYVKTYYWLLGSYIDADYYCLIGEPSGEPNPNSASDRRDNIVVPVGRLKKLLNIAGVR